MINLHHIEVTVDPPDDEYEPDHSTINLVSAAYSDQDGIEGHTFGEVMAARIRTKGVLSRLALMAQRHIALEARDHGCYPTVRGEAALVGPNRIDPNVCNISASAEEEDATGDQWSLYFTVPQDRADAWLKAIREWLGTIAQADTIDDPDEVIQ